jgi:hypothetical protein
MKARSTPAALAGLVVGYAVIVFGAVGLLTHLPLGKVPAVALWVAGADLLHDFAIAPLVCIVGLAIVRSAPPVWRWPLRGALTGTAVVLAVAYPALRGFGRDTAPGNPTVLPLDYTTSTLTALAVVWALALAWGIASFVSLRHRAPTGR